MEKTCLNNKDIIINAAKSENILHKKQRFIVWFLSIIGTVIGYSSVFDDIISSNLDQEYYYKNNITNGIRHLEWDDFNMLGFFFCFVACISGVSLVVKTFAELHHRTTSDMQYALPLSHFQRFISKLLSLGNCYFVPLIVPPAVLGIIASITSAFCPHVDTADVIFIGIWAVAIIFMLGLITVFTVTIVTVCCGRAAEPSYMSVILGACLCFIVPDIVWLISASNPYSYTGVDMFGKMSFCTYILALWGGESMSDSLSLVVNLLLCILTFAVVMYLSYRIYRKRDGRSVGKPIVFHAIFEIILCLGVFLSASIGLNYITIAISFVAYMIIRIVSEKENFKKKILAWVGLYIVYVAIVPIFMLVSNATNGFGTDNKIIREIKKADEIEYMDIDLKHYYYVNNDTYRDTGTDAESKLLYNSHHDINNPIDYEQVKEFLVALVENSKQLDDIAGSGANFGFVNEYYRSYSYTSNYELGKKYDKFYKLDINVDLPDDRNFDINIYFDDAEKAKEFAEFINANPFDAYKEPNYIPENLPRSN